MTIHVLIPLEEHQKARLEAIAEARQVPLEDVLIEVIEDYLADDHAFQAAVREGLASLDRGEGRDFEDVARELRARMDERINQSTT